MKYITISLLTFMLYSCNQLNTNAVEQEEKNTIEDISNLVAITATQIK